MPPGVYVDAPSVLVTCSATAALRASLSEPFAVLPAPDAFWSVAVAVLTSGSVVIADANPTGTVNTRLSPPPAPMLAPVVPKLVCPVVPVTVPQFAVPLAAHVAFAVSVNPAGSASVTVTLLAFDGPPLVTVTVYVAVPPGVYVALPSVLTTPSDTCAASVSVSVAELLPGLGSVTPAGAVIVAVLTSVPVAAADTVPLSVNVALPPTGRLTLALMLPEPAAGQVPPPAPTHVHAAPRIVAGTVSATVAPVTPLGPLLLATIV